MQGKWQLVAWWHHFPSPSGWKTSGGFTTEPWSTHSHGFETGAASQCSKTCVVQHIRYLASMSWLYDHTFHHLPQNMLSRCWVFPLSCATRCFVRSAGSWAQENWVISLRFPSNVWHIYPRSFGYARLRCWDKVETVKKTNEIALDSLWWGWNWLD